MTAFALIDCNNFFVSCERLFRPDLEGKPVVVLSSNDGCIVARSNEVKKLGIPMAAPGFKYRDAFRRHNIKTFSANFELYGDISKRITALLTTITPRIEIYSVDESFLDLSELPIQDYAEWGKIVRASILKHIGVPVSIGIAPTKTLAKLASEVAKQSEVYGGAVDWMNASQEWKNETLHSLPARSVWGVGWRLGPQLRAEGVSTARQLAALRPQHAQQIMGIRGRQMVAELNGTACFALTREHDPAKSIMRSRTFGEDTNQAHVLESAIATLGSQAAFALRRERLLARRIGFFTNTSRFKPGYRAWAPQIKLNQPTNDTGLIISLLTQKLAEIFSSSQKYHQLGVFLHDFVPENSLQVDLLGTVKPENHDRSTARMQALDAINKRHGRGKIRFAAEDLADSWRPKHHTRSPQYVSNWDELPHARIPR